MKLTAGVQVLWAKKARDGYNSYLPLVSHMEDAAAMAGLLWEHWLPDGVKQYIASDISSSLEIAKKLFVFTSAVHDIGKATAVFQFKTSSYIPNDLDRTLRERLLDFELVPELEIKFANPAATPHALASQQILNEFGVNGKVGAIIGAHHGKPPTTEDINNGDIRCCYPNYYIKKKGFKGKWVDLWSELLNYGLLLSGFDSIEDISAPDKAAQLLLCGMLIMVDWLVSNENYFPYIDVYDKLKTGCGAKRAYEAFTKMDFLHSRWDASPEEEGLTQSRFGFTPRPLQTAALEAATNVSNAGIFVIESTMGSGKTEAALLAAEIFCKKAKRAGIYFALPTQATSDGIFPRMLTWVSSLNDGIHSIELLHAKAQFNEDKRTLTRFGLGSGISDDDMAQLGSVPAVFDWFEGRKTALLADFVVGTVDNVLLAALRQRHVMLRHLGLANKVVIIDECHAYDAYMCKYLERALRWLGEYGVPIILLSATLPHSRTKSLIGAYTGSSDISLERTDSYPRITYTDGNEVKRICIKDDSLQCVLVDGLDEAELSDRVGELLANGGCAGIILNSVRRAQGVAKEMQERFGEAAVRLIHSRFTATDRQIIERELRSELGKPKEGLNRPEFRIVVGTQVLEQSLDIDFDVMITDIAPMDLLLQRMGRLHRHQRSRPKGLEEAKCFVLGLNDERIEQASKAIYGEYILIRTRLLMPKLVKLPSDISPLIEAVYSEDTAILPHIPDGYDKAEKDWRFTLSDKEARAGSFMMTPPYKNSTIVGLIKGVSIGDSLGEAAVRDSSDSLEVLAVGKGEDGKPFLLHDGSELPIDVPANDVAMKIAQEGLRLPPALSKPWIVKGVIAELESITHREFPLWSKSPWLRDALILPFDKNGRASLGGYRLRYDKTYGLEYEKEDSNEGT